MTDKTELRQLIEVVEAGNKRDFDWTDCILALGKKAHPSQLCVKAYHGSLDAAKALHEALLPGWGVEGAISGGYSSALVFLDGYRDDYSDQWQTLEGNNPARSWLIAILKAYEEQTS